MATLTFQKLMDNISGNKGVQKLLENFQKLNEEIKKKESEIKSRIDQEKDARIDMAWQKYQDIVKALGTSEAKLEKEVNNTLSKIKVSADQLEKNLASYKKKAMEQKERLEKTIFNRTSSSTSKKAAKASSKKSASKPKASVKGAAKKIAKKATKKTSKKS